MNPFQSLAVVASVVALSSCIPPGPGYPPPVHGPPPIPGPPLPGGGLQAQRDQAYQQGWGFGRKDALQGRQANYLLYNNYYSAATKKDFAAGYMNAYRRFRR
ncbi:hypothetical protein OKA05_19250 [Luteolibacter arcticus]|uniref:Lipoprotein n=1 Tax=Luteolibacter arcticus TaxID=1581411 RepID=A0ABT3GMJ4_9BACT|nr:hypothetical protein [Luteolibacter arcticus]MCW1924711.1 hypothetical protein [Luteolibacter arcticus]